ncbi:MAG TPA: STAS domain-containing protein [Candidatus Kapabacteria bacterium]|nr:STAS domain-containing protein [Candidatus Kapabacteria bacterium]
MKQEDKATIFVLNEPHLDGNISAELKAEFLIHCPDKGSFIVDLSGVKSCDPDGLSALLVAHRELESDGRNLKIAGASDAVMRIMRISQLHNRFEFFNSVKSANASAAPAKKKSSAPARKVAGKKAVKPSAKKHPVRRAKTAKKKKAK